MENQAIRMTLGDALRSAAAGTLSQGWLYLRAGEIDAVTESLLIPDSMVFEDEDDAEELGSEKLARELGFPIEGLDTPTIEIVCKGVLLLTPTPDDRLYVRAFVYYLKFDAALPNLDAGGPPPFDETMLKLDREFYDSLGEESATLRCRREGCDRGTVYMSAFCRKHHFENVRNHACPFQQ